MHAGIDKIEVDSGKSTLTVTGDADPVDVVTKTRKVCRFAEVMSIGPPPIPKPKQPDPPKTKPDPPKPPCPPLPCPPAVCVVCSQMDAQLTAITCSIL